MSNYVECANTMTISRYNINTTLFLSTLFSKYFLIVVISEMKISFFFFYNFMNNETLGSSTINFQNMDSLWKLVNN